jgi:hypothetical protein
VHGDHVCRLRRLRMAKVWRRRCELIRLASMPAAVVQRSTT